MDKALCAELARLEASARLDNLTSLGNHRAFYEGLKHEAAHASRYGRPLTLILVDVDDFKSVNGVYGHLHGDNALRDIAAQIAFLEQMNQSVAHVGGVQGFQGYFLGCPSSNGFDVALFDDYRGNLMNNVAVSAA